MIPAKKRVPGAAVFWSNNGASSIHHVGYLWKGVICSVRKKDLRWPQLSLPEGSDQGCLLIPATSKVPEYDQKKNTEEGDDLL